MYTNVKVYLYLCKDEFVKLTKVVCRLIYQKFCHETRKLALDIMELLGISLGITSCKQGCKNRESVVGRSTTL